MADTPTPRTRREQGRAVTVAVLVGVAGIVVGAGLVLVAAGVLGALGVRPSLAEGLIIAAVLSQVGFAATAVGYLTSTGRGLAYLAARFPTARDVAWIGGAYLLALAGAVVGGVIAMATGAPTSSNQVAELGLQEPGTLLWLIPISFLVIGPGEELLFRGTVQSRLREAFGPWTAVVAASALFASLHLVALTGGLSGRLVSVGLLFIPSLVLGAAYELTRNLVVTVVVHGAYNATLFALLYLAVTYAPGSV